MGQSDTSTLRRVVQASLKAQDIDLAILLSAPRSVESITKEIADRTGVPLSSRTVRRWSQDLKVAS